MGYGTDVYGSPEKFGLETVYSADHGEMYEFYMFTVWRDTKSVIPTYFYGTDAGCSCPSPYEDVCSVGDLTYGTKAEIIQAFKDWGGTDVEVADLTDALFRD